MKNRLPLLLLPLLISAGVFAQEPGAKTGWKISPFPAVSYNSNNGFQYGVFGDIYNYGNGSTYPDPLQKISFEASHFTKGRTRLRLTFDSKYLIPRMRLTVSTIYCHDPLYQFYGFNGPASPYDPALNDRYSGILYNSMRRTFFQAFANFQGEITDHLNWAAGTTYWYYKTGQFDGQKFGADQAYTLYQYYVNAGAIGREEMYGGHILELRGGFVFDSRDIEAAPNRGINADVFLNGAPDFTRSGHAYLRLCANFSQFLRIPVGFIRAGDPVFAYHLGYQHTWGDAPFYIQQNVPQLVPRRVLSEGLGGSTTIRGLYDNRIIADGFAWANLELRVKLVAFQLFRQDFYIAANPFFDCGMVTKTYRMDRMPATRFMYAGGNAQAFVMSAGGGLKLAWNENFILSVELAHCIKPVGMGEKLWLNISTNYSF